MVYCTGLENRRGVIASVGSNPTSSTIEIVFIKVVAALARVNSGARLIVTISMKYAG